MENEVLPSEIKDLLITWLFKFGHEAIPQTTAWDYLDNAYLNYDIDATLTECCNKGYIWEIETAKGYGYLMQTRYKILDKAIDFLNKGELNEQ